MNSQASRNLLGTYILVTVVSVTFFVSPWNSIDPVNLPKLFLLGILGFISGGLAITQREFLKSQKSKGFLILIGFFTLALLIVLFTSNTDFSFKMYGTPSRNTGFLAYFSLAMISLAACISASRALLRKYAITLISAGAILSMYGIAQWRGLDVFDYVNAYGSNVFGTFGNPNFQSAFMGIVAAASFVWLTLGSLRLRTRIALGVLVMLCLANIKLSSEQGYLNFVAGVTSAVIIYLFAKRQNLLAWTVLGISSVGATLITFGLFNSGPLAKFIYKSSLQARGFYWRAGLKMIVDHPLLGVGFDGFGDWYRRSRSQSAAEFNAGIVADTAHNIPLDLGASGGIPLLFAYLALIILVVISIVRVVKRTSEFDVVFASIVAAWVAYQAQSLISINQLGLGVWGWSLSGLIIGYELNARDIDVKMIEKSQRKSSQGKEKIPASVLLVAFVAGAVGLVVSLPPYLAANKYYNALKSGNANVLKEGAYLKPYDRTRFLYTAQILASNKLEAQAIAILKDASVIYPDNFELWQQWAQIASATPEEIAKAKAEMKRLDPYNPALR
ncbi:RfaL Lipid A core - O-antigen ligase and related enzymes [Candidatus Nanopelagicaceae bacterium]